MRNPLELNRQNKTVIPILPEFPKSNKLPNPFLSTPSFYYKKNLEQIRATGKTKQRSLSISSEKKKLKAILTHAKHRLPRHIALCENVM